MVCNACRTQYDSDEIKEGHCKICDDVSMVISCLRQITFQKQNTISNRTLNFNFPLKT